MSKPSVGGLEKMTRIGKFLAGRPRVVWEFPNQEPQEVIDVYVDANKVFVDFMAAPGNMGPVSCLSRQSTRRAGWSPAAG